MYIFYYILLGCLMFVGYRVYLHYYLKRKHILKGFKSEFSYALKNFNFKAKLTKLVIENIENEILSSTKMVHIRNESPTTNFSINAEELMELEEKWAKIKKRKEYLSKQETHINDIERWLRSYKPRLYLMTGIGKMPCIEEITLS